MGSRRWENASSAWYTHIGDVFMTNFAALGAQPLPGTPVAFAPDHVVFSAAPSGVLSVYNLTRLQKSTFLLGTFFFHAMRKLIGSLCAAPQGQRATVFTTSAHRVALACEDGSVVVFLLDDTAAAPAYAASLTAEMT